MSDRPGAADVICNAQEMRPDYAFRFNEPLQRCSRRHGFDPEGATAHTHKQNFLEWENFFFFSNRVKNNGLSSIFIIIHVH